MRRYAAVTAVILLLLLSFSGCGNGQPGVTNITAPATQPVSTTPSTSTPVTTTVPAPAASSGVVIDARFVDVGQGDCEILKISQGSSTFFALVDTGDKQSIMLAKCWH